MVEVLVTEEVDRLVQLVINVVVMEHFPFRKAVARVMLVLTA